VFDKETAQDFGAWFALHAPDQKYSDIQNFESYFGAKGFRREDWLTYYFATPNRVYVIVYHTTDSDVVNYRTVGKVMARSFVTGEQGAASSLPTPVFTTTTLVAPLDSTVTTAPVTATPNP
jgi:hypothetical protein